MLPCNVSVYEADDGGTTVSIVDPVAAMGAFGSAELQQVASDAKQRLAAVLEAL